MKSHFALLYNQHANKQLSVQFFEEEGVQCTVGSTVQWQGSIFFVSVNSQPAKGLYNRKHLTLLTATHHSLAQRCIQEIYMQGVGQCRFTPSMCVSVHPLEL